MKKQLYLISVLAIILTLAISFSAAIPLTQFAYKKQTADDLKDSLLLLSFFEETQDGDELTEQFNRYVLALSESKQNVRVTVADTLGNVLCDSEKNEIDENHLDRKEFRQALSNTWGFDTRKSRSINEKYFYAAYYNGGKYIYRLAVPLDGLSRVHSVLWLCAFFGIIIGCFFAVVCVRLMSAAFLKPINSLTKATREITAGDLSVRVQGAPAELGELSTAFNIMTDRLEHAYTELENGRDTLNSILLNMADGVIAVDSNDKILLLTPLTETLLGKAPATKELRYGESNYAQIDAFLQKSISEQSAFREEMKFTSPEERILQVYSAPMSGKNGGALAVIADITRIKQLEQMRSEFAANVTHELKTPLTSIRGYIELLKDDYRDKETQKQFYDIIEIEAERLQNLIDDILSLSVIEHGHEDAPSSSTSIRDTVEKVALHLKPVSEKNDVKIKIKIPEDLYIQASPVRFQQLIWNLTENAVKYNKPGGTVIISAEHENGFTAIHVADTGIGISKEQQPRIFERFYRVDKGRSRQLGGTGLGLSIVKHIVNLYKGDISVDSVLGQGTVFTVRFPEK